MGARGPKPKPEGWFKQTGTRMRGDVPRDMLSMPVAAPECPLRLTGEAKACWDRVLPLLLSAGVVSVTDGAVLARYCVLWGRWVEAEKALADCNSFAVSGEDVAERETFVHPAVKIADSLCDKLLRIEEQFGMTPSSRTRIGVKKPTGMDPKKTYGGPRPGPGMNDDRNSGGGAGERPDDSAANAG